MTYCWAEHTSEVELHVEAASEGAVFEQALQAFGELISEERAAEPLIAEPGGQPVIAEPGGQAIPVEAGSEPVLREVILTASDRAALLAVWLDELAYLAESEDLVPEGVERLQLSCDRLHATVRAHRGRPRHLVKGVTYHRLAFGPTGEGFQATAVLDV